MFKKNGGFTLVELIVVIAILAILAGVAVPVYSGYITKANEAADYTALDSIKTAAIFAVTEKDPAAVVTTITVGTNAKAVSVTTTTTSQTPVTSVDISAYTGAETITYKSGATGATWNNDPTDNVKDGWTLTK